MDKRPFGKPLPCVVLSIILGDPTDHGSACMNTSKKHKRYQLTPKEVPISNVLTFLGKNELGDADFFAEVFADQVCYDHSDGKWYLWNGHPAASPARQSRQQRGRGPLQTL